MKKKIICFAILGMFLLLSSIPLLVIGQKVETTEKTSSIGDDLPDLTIEIKFDRYLNFGRQIQFNYCIYNKGTGYAPKSWVVFRIYGDLEEDSYPHFNRFGPEGFTPGKVHSGTLSVPTSTLTGNIIKAVIDPVYTKDYRWPELNPDPKYGLIFESNEDNNIDTVFVPKARSRNTINQGGLIDNINVELIGTPMLLVVMNIWDILRPGQPSVISYLDIDTVNNNDEKVTLNAHLIVDTRDGRTIFENTITDNIPAKHGGSMPFSFNRDTLVQQSYLTGIFDATLELYVEEDGSQKTLSFKGFFFNYGSIVFNPRGKVIG